MKRLTIYLFFGLSSLSMIGFTQDVDHPLEISDSCIVVADTLYSGCGDCFNCGVFQPYFNCPIEDYQLKIYNRWGECIFETQDIYEFWNFTEVRMDGTFYYLITGTMSDSGTPFAVLKKGTVIVLK